MTNENIAACNETIIASIAVLTTKQGKQQRWFLGCSILS